MSAYAWLMTGLAAMNCWQVLRQRPLHTGMTSVYSWFWTQISALVLLAAAVLSGPFALLNPAWTSGLQYLAAILMLTPAVCLLGARRPGVAAWQWFVVLPLVFVLAWPGAIQIVNSRGRIPIELSLPALSGFLLVALMSTAPGLGRGMTVACLLQLGTTLTAVSPVVPWLPRAPWLFLSAASVQLLATVLAGRCLKRHHARLRQSASLHQQTTQLWLLFQDIYGMIWAQRLLDRAREFERTEKWACSLTLDGFTTLATPAETEQAIARTLPAFRWLLGRFFSGTWLDSRLTAAAENVLRHPPESSASSLASPEPSRDDSDSSLSLQHPTECTHGPQKTDSRRVR